MPLHRDSQLTGVADFFTEAGRNVSYKGCLEVGNDTASLLRYERGRYFRLAKLNSVEFEGR